MQRFMKRHKRKIVAAVCILIAFAMLAAPIFGAIAFLFG